VLSETEVVNVQLRLGNKQTLTKSHTIRDLVVGLPVEFFVTPTDAGETTISVEIDPSNLISEANENNNQASLAVSVKPVRDVRLA